MNTRTQPLSQGDTVHVTLGKKYRDTITGFEGVATARYEFLFGCVRYLLEGEMDGGKEQQLTVDEQRLVCAETETAPTPTATTGGPQHDPTPYPTP